MFSAVTALPLTSDRLPMAVGRPVAITPAPAGASEPPASEPPASGRESTTRAPPAESDRPDPWKLDPARDPFAQLGPRPAFAANILDAERLLQSQLARMELARSRSELLHGTAPPGPPGTPATPSFSSAGTGSLPGAAPTASGPQE